MTQTYKVQVSMNQAHIVESGFVWKQGDFGFNIEIEVLDFDTTGATPQIIFRKSTGAVEATQISVAGNKFTYAIRGTELDTPGPCVCDLKLNDSTTKRVSTASFKYFVIPDTMDGLEQEASSYSDTIEQIVDGFSDDIASLNNKAIDISNTFGSIYLPASNGIAQSIPAGMNKDQAEKSLKAIKLVLLEGMQTDTEYFIRNVGKRAQNGLHYIQIGLVRNGSIAFAATWDKTYTDSNGLEWINIPQYQSSGVTGKVLIDWSEVTAYQSGALTSSYFDKRIIIQEKDIRSEYEQEIDNFTIIDPNTTLAKGMMVHRYQVFKTDGTILNAPPSIYGDIYSYIECLIDEDNPCVFDISGNMYASGGSAYYGYYFLNANNEIIEYSKGINNGPFSRNCVVPPIGAVKLIVNGLYGSTDARPRIVAHGIPYVGERTNAFFDKEYNDRPFTAQGEIYEYSVVLFHSNKETTFEIKGYSYANVTAQSGGRLGYYFFDKDFNLLLGQPSMVGAFTEIVKAPDNACILIVNGHNNDYSKATVVERETNTNWVGKKIVWFGTSIPAGGNVNPSYPLLVGEKLGATVYNESLPSSPISDYSRNGKGLALAYTYAEKQAQPWWDVQPEEYKIKYRNAAFDYKVTKYLSGGSVGPVDLYVFDHGYNDYDYLHPDDYLKDPDNPFDKAYPMGAASFIINSILEDNPRAQIIWIGHYENKLNDPTDHQSWGQPVAAFQEKICNKYGLPLCKTWEKTGWSNPNKVETTGYWDGTTWIPSGGTSRDDYIKNCMFSDGIHPHSDGSGKAERKIANIIIDFINSL